MLVGCRLAETLKAQRLTAGDHRECEVANLFALHTVDEDGHCHGSHLLVANIAASVGIHEPVDLVRRERTFVTLGVDKVNDVETFNLRSVLAVIHRGTPQACVARKHRELLRQSF